MKSDEQKRSGTTESTTTRSNQGSQTNKGIPGSQKNDGKPTKTGFQNETEEEDDNYTPQRGEKKENKQEPSPNWGTPNPNREKK